MEQLTGVIESYLPGWKVAKNEARVLLVTSSRLYASGLQLLLNQQSERHNSDFRMAVTEPEEILRLSEDGTLAHYLHAGNYGVVLLGTVQTNYELTLQLSHFLSTSWQTGPVLWLDMPDDRQKILGCIRAGAKGFVLETESHDDFCIALLRAIQGKAVCSDKALTYLFERLAFSETLTIAEIPALSGKFELTRRELEVLEALSAGRSNREIAGLLSIELRTVKNHVHNILGKLQVSKREDAVLLAHRHNLISRPYR